jgi:hypothetical protein
MVSTSPGRHEQQPRETTGPVQSVRQQITSRMHSIGHIRPGALSGPAAVSVGDSGSVSRAGRSASGPSPLVPPSGGGSVVRPHAAAKITPRAIPRPLAPSRIRAW